MPAYVEAVRALKSMLVAWACLVTAPWVAAQPLQLRVDGTEDPARLARAVAELAVQLSATYRDQDRATYLDNLFRLQLGNGAYEEAEQSLADLAALPKRELSPQVGAARVPYEIFVHAKIAQARQNIPFDEAFQQAFRDTFRHLDDRTSARVIRTMFENPAAIKDEMRALIKERGTAALSVPDALSIVRLHQTAEMYESIASLVPPLVAEDDDRRYLIERDVLIPTPDGAALCLLVVRPRSGTSRLPTLFDFTIYAQPDRGLASTRRGASNGYAAVEGYVRGKACSDGRAVPYERDADDATTIIDWISRQAWSDGQVGMWSGSYAGMTQWAAAKRMPKALKAMMPMASAAPGIDVPMEGNVFWNFIYPWPFYATNTKLVDDATYNDSARWQRLNRNWYVSGRAYRDMPQIDGTANPIWTEWIAHPSYDAYWQRQIAYGQDFARIKIPVLSTAGYYGGGPGASVYYFTEHYKHDPNAEHYLVIGPYEHFEAQRGMIDQLGRPVPSVRGDRLDAAAVIDIGELRYQWFDYALRGGPKPDLLKDKVNYQVTGANVWKHAPSIPAMSNGTLRLHLGTVPTDNGYRLETQAPARGRSVTLKVDLADRSDADRVPRGGSIIDKDIDTWNGIEYVSDPLPAAVEVTGLFSGRLEFMTNKKDFDFNIQLYELTPQHEYVELAPYWARASYVGDLGHRRLLRPGKRQRLDFKSVRLMSHRVRAGSRVIAVLSVIKGPDRQINYGSGKEVSDETIADAGEPLTIDWFDTSFIDIPVHK